MDVDGTTSYAYDARDQLTAADHTGVANPDENYVYDANGNRINSHLHGNGYQTDANNRLVADGTFTYAYDDEGNLILRTNIADSSNREFQWDFHNRLTVVIDKTAGNVETQRVEFTYDTFDRRISKNVVDAADIVLKHFVYDGQDVLLDFIDDDGAAGLNASQLAQRYLHGPGIDQVLAQNDGTGNTLWHLADHLGTIRDLTDSAGAVVNHLLYDSYGNLIRESNAAETSRYRFTGREFDSETGLYFYRARYYDAATGRFISEGPIAFGGGDTNLARYVFNSPATTRDPSGNGGLMEVLKWASKLNPLLKWDLERERKNLTQEIANQQAIIDALQHRKAGDFVGDKERRKMKRSCIVKLGEKRRKEGIDYCKH